MPYDNGENIEEYLDCLSSILSLIEDHPNNHVFTIGDFNAHPQSRFGRELEMVSRDSGLVVGDVRMLPGDTYTWVSDATGHTRWLDHVVCPEALLPHLLHMHVNYTTIASDHRALNFEIDLGSLPPLVQSNTSHGISYSVKDVMSYHSNTENSLKNISLPINALMCRGSPCHSEEHRNEIQCFYGEIISALLTYGDNKRSPRPFEEVPGWNELVKLHHREARAAYLHWRANGKPRYGQEYREMTQTRQRFKLALKNCNRQYVTTYIFIVINIFILIERTPIF